MRKDVRMYTICHRYWITEMSRYFVSADVEHREDAHGIGVRKVGAAIGHVSPCRTPGYARANVEVAPTRPGVLH